MSKKKRMPLGGLTVALLSASVVLLAGSTVGSARAALTYYSENYGAQVEVSKIGVSLEESNDKGKSYTKISKRNYISNGKWDEATGDLLTGLKEEKIVPGKQYDEAIKVTNSGSIDSYVRVILKKSWTNKEGVKDTTLESESERGKWLGDRQECIYKRENHSLLYRYPSGRKKHTGTQRYVDDRRQHCYQGKTGCHRKRRL